MESLFSRRTTAPASVAFVRVATGLVFLVSGVVKFVYENQGVGRFTKLGLPAPAALSTFVGAVEVVGGTLLVLGLFTRLAALPLIVDMLVALGWTKVPFLFGPGREPVSSPPKTGLLAFLYQARLDFTMLACVVFFLVAGAGLWSLDARARSKS